MRKRIYWRGEISSAHRLNLPYESKCVNIHGHNYIVEVEIEGEKNEFGMILDYTHIKEAVKKYDHVDLNDFLEQPTAENLAERILLDIVNVGREKGGKIEKVKVRVWEDKDSYAEVEGVIE